VGGREGRKNEGEDKEEGRKEGWISGVLTYIFAI